jgi:hypothetical protein
LAAAPSSESDEPRIVAASIKLVARIVVQIVIFKAERADRRHVCDLFTGFRPVEMPGLAGQDDDAAWRIEAPTLSPSNASPSPM